MPTSARVSRRSRSSSFTGLRSLLLATAVTSAGVLGGCYTEGGLGFSNDEHVYVSRPWEPKTITLRDTRTGQEFWSMDLPVGKKLVIIFESDTGTKDKYTPDTMKWVVVDEARETDVSVTNNLPCPPADSRRLEMTLRTAPELPESMITATKGTLTPQKVQMVRPAAVTPPSPSANGPSGQP